MSINQLLSSIGLSNKEIQVYLTIIKMQPSKAKDVALFSELARPTTYDILKNLDEKNLIYEFEQNGVKYFAANEPDAIIEYIEKKKKLFEQYKKDARSMLPQLELLKHPERNRPEITFLDGEDGMKEFIKLIHGYKNCKVFFEIKTENKNIQNILEGSQWKKTVLQILLPHSEENIIFHDTSKHSCKILTSPSGYTADTFLFGEYMAIISYEELPQIMLIKNNDISKTHQHIFNTLWKMS